jgi:arylsulfatase A-like enzyme
MVRSMRLWTGQPEVVPAAGASFNIVISFWSTQLVTRKQQIDEVSSYMHRNTYSGILISAAWWGLLAGLLEGAAYYRFPLLRNPDLPWIAVLFACAVFLILGLVLALLARFVQWRALFAGVNLVFALVAFYDCATVGVGEHGERVLMRLVALALAVCVALGTWKFSAGWQGLQRKTAIWIALFALFYTGVAPVRRALRERRELAAVSDANHSPNVLVIIVDALRDDHLSTYGYSRETSPYITKLASQGVLFQSVIAAAPWTLPSHASILTGRLPHETGADRPDGSVDQSLPTLAGAFRQRGYRTAAFSANWWFFARRLGFGPGFVHFEDFSSLTSAIAQTNLGQRIQNLLLKVGVLHAAIGRARAEQINSRMLRWLDSGSGPFFVVANYMDVHEPYLPPLDCFHRFSKLARPAGQVFIGNPQMDHLTPREVQNEMDAYDASIYCLDGQIAAVLQALQQRQLMSNTIVVFTSDHGDGFGEHGLMSHGNSLYRELIHVPLIMVGPGIPAGRVVERPASLMWLAPTLLSLTGASKQPFPGPAMNLGWTGTAQSLWPDPVSELAQMYQDANALNYSGALLSVVTSKWHLIAGGPKGDELYDHGEDKAEAHNLAGANSAVAQMLKGELQREVAGKLAKPGQPSSGTVDQPLRKQDAAERQKMNDYLKALGYVPN